MFLKMREATRDKQGLSLKDLSRSYLAFDSYVTLWTDSEVKKMQGHPSTERHAISMHHIPVLREVNTKIQTPNAEFSH